MSLCKAISHGKEHRKPYYGAKAVDWSCTNHGSCVWCRRNRLHSTLKRVAIAEDTRKQYLEERASMNPLEYKKAFLGRF